jgi:SM-20-related protein
MVDNFLEVDIYQQLRTIAQTLHQQGSFQSAKIGLKIQAQNNQLIRNDEIYWLDKINEQHSIQLYLQTMNDLALVLNHSLFLSLCDFETHFAVYKAGSFYKKHVDQFQATKTRKISCVYYLNEHWDSSFGGTLKLYTEQDQLIQEITPLGNRFICFNSELPHEVCRTEQTRYSIAGWMKTRSSSPMIEPNSFY